MIMMIVPIIVILAVGIIMGSLASNMMLMRGRGFGLDGNIIAGLLGSFIGGILNITGIIGDVLDVNFGGLPGTLIWATIGAASVLFIIGLTKKADEYE